MIIDFHTHAFPDSLAPKALQALSENSGEYRPFTDGTIAGLMASMEKNGISTSVIANIATKPAQAQPIREWSAALKSNQLIPLSSVHPASEQWEEELSLAAAAGLKGIKLHPLYQSFSVDDRSLYPFYEKIQELGMFILFHAGYDIAFPGVRYASPDKLLRMISDFPAITVVAAHLGGWNNWDEVAELLAGKELYLETSFISMIDPALRDAILSRHDSNRIVFGTDSPWIDAESEIAFVSSLALSDSVREKIFSVNAQRILSL